MSKVKFTGDIDGYSLCYQIDEQDASCYSAGSLKPKMDFDIQRKFYIGCRTNDLYCLDYTIRKEDRSWSYRISYDDSTDLTVRSQIKIKKGKNKNGYWLTFEIPKEIVYVGWEKRAVPSLEAEQSENERQRILHLLFRHGGEREDMICDLAYKNMKEYVQLKERDGVPYENAIQDVIPDIWKDIRFWRTEFGMGEEGLSGVFDFFLEQQGYRREATYPNRVSKEKEELLRRELEVL